MKVNVTNMAELEKYIAAHEDGELEIVLEPGIFYLENTLKIENKKNIKIVGKDGARIVGGRVVKAAKTTDENVLSRIDEDKRSMIYEIDLRASGVSDDESVIDCLHAIGLSVDGEAMHVSQYPKRSKYIYITDHIKYDEPKIVFKNPIKKKSRQ